MRTQDNSNNRPISVSNELMAEFLCETRSEAELDAEIARLVQDGSNRAVARLGAIQRERQRRREHARRRDLIEKILGWAEARQWRRELPRVPDPTTGRMRPWPYAAIGPGQEAWERIVFEVANDVLELVWCHLTNLPAPDLSPASPVGEQKPDLAPTQTLVESPAEQRPRRVRGPKAAWRSSAEMQAAIRTALTSLRRTEPPNRPIRIRKLARKLGYDPGYLRERADSFGIDLDQELRPLADHDQRPGLE